MDTLKYVLLLTAIIMAKLQSPPLVGITTPRCLATKNPGVHKKKLLQ